MLACKKRSTCMLAVAVYAILLLITGSNARAQEEESFGVFPHSAPGGMLLILGGDMLHPDLAQMRDGWVGYHIYRKGKNDTGFVRITANPVIGVGSLTELESKLGRSIEGLQSIVGAASKEELWTMLRDNDERARVLLVISKDLRRTMGLLYLDGAVTLNESYAYRATRLNAGGEESEPSVELSATMGIPPFPLVGPLDVSAEVTPEGVSLGWAANPADSGAFSYNVYRTPDPGGTPMRLNLAPLAFITGSTTDTLVPGTFVDTTAESGRTYYYSVRSADYAGNESPVTQLVNVWVDDVDPPAIPQEVMAEPGESGITITWQKVSDPDAIGYHVYRSLDPDSNYVRINRSILPGDTGYFEDNSADLNNRYFYRVTSVDASGNESLRSARAVSLFENRFQPLPPQGVTAEAGTDEIRLTWTRSPEPDVRGYYVFRADRYNGPLTQISELIDIDSTHFADTSDYLAPQVTYWYLVQAINFSGISSKFSEPVVASVEAVLAPDPPTSFIGFQDISGVRLFWTPPDDNAIAGFNVYRADRADNANWTKLTDLSLSYKTGEYIDTSVIAGKSYFYHVKSVSGGGMEGVPSHTVSVLVFQTVPLAPSNVRVIIDDVGIKVLWDSTAQADVIGYRVYRRAEKQDAALLTVNPIPLALSEYVDGTINPGIRYFYSVSCIDKFGRESGRSIETEFMIR